VSGTNTLIRIWASAGIRMVGRCPLLSNCSDPGAVQIDTITLTPPFLGRDAGVGIGSSRAEVEADVGSGAARDDNGVVVYGDPSLTDFLQRRGATALGVVYAQDSACVERAVGLVFNYITQ
jgi:hypothetical protein